MSKKQRQLREPDWPHFGERVSLFRQSLGMSVRDAAMDIPVSPATLSRVERGNECTVGVFLTICEWADIPPLEAAS